MTESTFSLKPARLTLSLKFVIGCSLALITALGITFALVAQRQEKLIMEQVEREAHALFTQVVITRSWIADHGGIFVEKLPWMKPSPYLKESEIVDVTGKRYIRRTPAMVTKDLSKYSKEKGLYWFHITSLNLTNPENAPDTFESNALGQFEKEKTGELMSIDTIDNAKYLRYIAPLYIEEACLKCHAGQGYKIGDIRGAISIVIPVDKTFADISANRRSMFIAAVITVLTLVAAMFLMMKRLVLTPMAKLKSSMQEFSEARYSSAVTIKTGDEFEDLSRAFTEMTGRLTEYHDCLNERVQAATRDLEETNARLKEANRLLSSANVKKSDFIARASHEIRTPLTSIKGAMDYISARLSSLPPPVTTEASLDDLQIFFEVIKKNAERLIRMVNDMLDLERIEMGTSELRFASVDLSRTISETLTYFHITADERGLSLRADLPEAITVRADEDRIRQVLINLLSNALKFSPPGSEIRTRSYRDEGHVVTEVCDDGPGIPASEQEKIFEKFYKRGGKEGVGLGLAVCKSIVEAHQGIIGVRSDGERGSCFYFELPARDIHESEISQARPTAGETSCREILLEPGRATGHE